MNALILAGARDEGMGGSVPRGSYRAGLIVGGRSLLELAASALVELPGLQRIVLVGPEELVPEAYREKVDRIVPPVGDLLGNLREGLSVLPDDEPVLVMASDLPLLTRAALRDFLERCAERRAEIHYPIIRREVYESAYPGSLRTYVRMRDGIFTGGNVVLLTPAAFRRHEHLIAKAVTWRKQPLRLGRLLGPGFFLGLMMRRFSVAEIEARVAARLGLRAVAVESRFSEIGFDVDSQADVQWIEFYWGGTLEGGARSEPELDDDE